MDTKQNWSQDQILKLSCSKTASIKSNAMKHLDITFSQFSESLSRVIVTEDKTKVPYYLRAQTVIRSDKEVADTAYIIILDGDSHISSDGEIIDGAPPLDDVATVLEANDVPFVAYTTFSHVPSKWKYRVAIPCVYSREQLRPLLWYIFKLLHDAGVMLHDVKENSTWAQAWFMPSVRSSEAKEHFQYRCFNGGEHA
tara:strand:- start:3360 stop:3950 length:591 start_codon:yes stop_codon:yes gene_type:complete